MNCITEKCTSGRKTVMFGINSKENAVVNGKKGIIKRIGSNRMDEWNLV